MRMFTLQTCGAIGAAAVVLVLAPPASAQDEEALRSFFEGKRVVLKIDMPGTADGVDVRPDSRRPVDYERYRHDLKKFGTAIRSGETAMVTRVKLKKDLIEFQLGGGGFGTFGDDTGTSVHIPLVEKSAREKWLERQVKAEEDRRRKKQLERELDDLRERRERQNSRIEAERAIAEEHKRRRVAAERRAGGSRFNLRYSEAVPTGMRPDELVAALSDYVDFRPVDSQSDDGSLLAAGDLAPRKGMLRADAERAFGSPVSSSNRREGSVVVTTLVFLTDEERITAEFVEDVLFRYTVASK
jgi:hypothetical protein